MMCQELQPHTLVRNRTSILIAEIFAVDVSRTLFDRDFMLLAALPDTPLGDAGLSRFAINRALEQVGGYLHQLHA
jgi:hypothetical protein